MKHCIIGSLLFFAQFLNVPIAAQPPIYADVLLETVCEVECQVDTTD